MLPIASSEHIRTLFTALLVFIFFMAQPACALVINAAPGGSASTTLEDLQENARVTVSLERALALLKSPALRDATGALNETITLQLASGTYRLSETIKLDNTHSGSAKHTITIQGPKDGSAIIAGGRAVNGFEPVIDAAILARLPEAARTHVLQTNLPKQGITDFGKFLGHGLGANNIPTALEVTYKNQPMTLARWPNNGFAKIAAIPEGEKGLTFTLQGANPENWKDEPNLLATGYWLQNWSDETIPLKIFNIVTQKLSLTKPHYYGMKIGQPVFIQNALAELDQPGEWYLNVEKGVLYFWPPAAINENEVEVSVIEKLLVIENASHIHLENLTFQSARGDGITIDGGHHVEIAHSAIRNIGNRGAVVSGQNNGLTDMLIEYIGEAAVMLNGGDRQTLTSAELYVEHSILRHFARVSLTYQPGVGLAGVGNRAVDNQISDSPHNAILFTGNDHLITHNEIFDVCKDVGDAGAIYTGRDWTARGTIISYNYFHNIHPNIELGRTKGVYLDDQASGMIVRGNLFEKIDEAVFIGGGRDNLIENNTFLKGNYPIHLDARGKQWKQAKPMEVKSDLQRNLEAVPYKEMIYRNRYPHLENLLEDDPGMPKYNIARDNLLIGKIRLSISKDAETGISIHNSLPLFVSEGNK
jgi:hypothetical protein